MRGDVWSEGMSSLEGIWSEERGGRSQTPPPPTFEIATAAVSTHPTGIHSSFVSEFILFLFV